MIKALRLSSQEVLLNTRDSERAPLITLNVNGMNQTSGLAARSHTPGAQICQ
jgi:hypothetical protein